MTEAPQNERTQIPKRPYWTVERVDEIIRCLKSKYPADAEDTPEVCALFEYRKALHQAEAEPTPLTEEDKLQAVRILAKPIADLMADPPNNNVREAMGFSVADKALSALLERFELRRKP